MEHLHIQRTWHSFWRSSSFPKPFVCRRGLLALWSAWDWLLCVIAHSTPPPPYPCPQTPRRCQTQETHQRCEYSSCYTSFHCGVLIFLLFFLLIEKKTQKSYKSSKRQQYRQDIRVPCSRLGQGSLPHLRAGRNTPLGPNTSAALAEQSLRLQGHAGAVTPATCTKNVPLRWVPGYGCPIS